MCFFVNFAKILGTPLLQNTTGELLLKMDTFQSCGSTAHQTDCMIQIFEKYQCRSSILIKLQCDFNKNGTLSQAHFNWFSTDVEQLLCRTSLSGCF